jgi:hypothetical protein
MALLIREDGEYRVMTTRETVEEEQRQRVIAANGEYIDRGLEPGHVVPPLGALLNAQEEYNFWAIQEEYAVAMKGHTCWDTCTAMEFAPPCKACQDEEAVYDAAQQQQWEEEWGVPDNFDHLFNEEGDLL